MTREDRLTRFIDAMARDRRPRAFPAEEEDVDMLRAAAALGAVRPGRNLPRAAFIAELSQQLRRRKSADDLPVRGRLNRRAFLYSAGTGAAALATGVVVGERLRPEEANPSQPLELAPRSGNWMKVAALADIPVGTARRFSAGSLEGYAVNSGGDVYALSAICTHMGCTLRFRTADRRFLCPCHGATFALDGSFTPGGYDQRLAALPRLRSRLNGSHLEVYSAPA